MLVAAAASQQLIHPLKAGARRVINRATSHTAKQFKCQMQQSDPPDQRRKFTVAIEGCCHGELDNIYATLAHLERVERRKVDLLICCGDFQAVRNLDDLETMSVPPKYRDIMTFYKYYKGEKVAPVPTLFIGGNHEASNYLWELHYGGWAAPNIYFLGYAGAVRFGGHRVAGLSGTYVAQHYHWGHHEKLPYDDRMVKSAYHVRQLHVHRLMQLKQPTSIFLSHDWPNLITRYGNSTRLFQQKPYFKKEAERGDLGSPANQQLLEALQPDYYFAAHLHCKFPAVVQHANSAAAANCISSNQKQQQQQQQQQHADASVASSDRVTRFLALDKCLPGRDFLQVVELEAIGPLEFCYDPEWLAILRGTHHLMTTTRTAPPLPANWGGRAGPAAEDLAFVNTLFEERGTTAIPNNFVQTAPAYNSSTGRTRGNMPRADLRNPQTEAFLQLLGLEYNLHHAANSSAAGNNWTSRAVAAVGGAGTNYKAATGLLSQQQCNPEEIDIDSDDAGDAPEAAGMPATAAQGSATAAAGGDAFETALDDEQSGNHNAAADSIGGAMADGAPESDPEDGDGQQTAIAAAPGSAGDSQQHQQQHNGLDDPMFGRVNTAEFPYYTGM